MPDEKKDDAKAPDEALLAPGDLDKIVEDSGGEAAEDALASGVAAMPLDLPDLSDDSSPASPGSIDLLMDVDLEVKIELGRAQMPIEHILKLKKGAVVELDKLAGDPIDILVNDRCVARGEILVVNDNFCVRITEIIDPEASLRSEAKHE